MSFKKIIVALNDSPLGDHVFAAALELALSTKAAITLLHCVTSEIVAQPTVQMPYETGLQPNFPLTDYESQRLVIEQHLEEAQAILERYRSEAISQGVPVELDCQIGEVGNQLCEAAKDWGADLIVVGRRGRKGLAEALLGSVSNYVVHNAPCSVLVIQDVETEQPAS
jgi:nucleotide-binding universal stress UspA family protein